ncbi:hypothetical protein ACIRLA_22095 [Streptomyces sp. NPDC102364]|uniref:hypothetical protein n=1 Tax=Streptomyces sp. NPDC102364 TaxID=3366161 RepID=UPI003818E9DC
MAARRNNKQAQSRRTSAAATTKPVPDKTPVAPVQSQAAVAAAEALLTDARTKANAMFTKAGNEASVIVAAANKQRDTLLAEAKQAGGELHRKASGEADRLLAEASKKAQQLRVDADTETAEVQAQAELVAQRTEKAAQARAEARHRAASEDAERLVADARERARITTSDAIEEAHRLVHEAKDESDRILAEARAEAEQSRGLVEKARADAAFIVNEGKSLRAKTLATADRQAREIREAALAETARQEQRNDALDTWSARAVIVGAVGLTASGEYELARMVGFDARVAWLLPLVIDVYVVQAFRRHRDILQAIALTIAANVVFHLADKGLFGVDKVARGGHDPEWWLIALVASIASLILWRMHHITTPQGAAPEGQKRAPITTELPRQKQPAEATEPATTPVANSTTSGDSNERQKPAPVADKNRQKPTAKKATTGDKKPPAKTRQKPSPEKPPRRSMTEWVTLTEPIFHAEFKRLKRNPTASEFADAIGKAGHGRPSDSTAKSIRTEVLDRAELPSLDTE